MGTGGRRGTPGLRNLPAFAETRPGKIRPGPAGKDLSPVLGAGAAPWSQGRKREK